MPPKARELESASFGGGGAVRTGNYIEVEGRVHGRGAVGGGELAGLEGEDGGQGFDGSGGSDGVAVEGVWWS